MRMRPPLVFVTCLAACAAVPDAHAFIVSISGSTPRSIYLRVGDGGYSGTFISNGTPQNSATVNRVSVTVPAASLGNGTPLVMTSSATQATSHYDGFAFCNLPNEVYVGGFYRGTASSGNGLLTATVTQPLANASGDTIPFSQISWTSSGNGDTVAQPFPAGTFTGGTQTLASFPVNTWRESCHAFSYANSSVVAAGTYNGRVTYTLSVP